MNETTVLQQVHDRVRMIDREPPSADLLADAVAGFSQSPKRLQSKYFYDALGSKLFEAITELPEYYLTRTEHAILRSSLREMADLIGPEATLIEFGSGAGIKTTMLLDALESPRACCLIDISQSALLESSLRLAERYPQLELTGICADYSQPLGAHDLDLERGLDRASAEVRDDQSLVAFFPGSTIGNFDRAEAIAFLKKVAALVGPTGSLLIGFDRKKDPHVIEAAYNDALGITAAFNLNLLRRLNRHGAEFDLAHFSHRAPYLEEEGRIEMHLVSDLDQRVLVADQVFGFARGESILTEYSHKYDLDGFAAMAGAAGFELTHEWSDERQWFSVCLLRARGAGGQAP